MEPNFVAQKQLVTEAGEPGPRVIENRKAYDPKTRAFSYWQRITQYSHQIGGEAVEGEWYPIRKSEYDSIDKAEIHLDNHP